MIRIVSISCARPHTKSIQCGSYASCRLLRVRPASNAVCTPASAAGCFGLLHGFTSTPRSASSLHCSTVRDAPNARDELAYVRDRVSSAFARSRVAPALRSSSRLEINHRPIAPRSARVAPRRIAPIVSAHARIARPRIASARRARVRPRSRARRDVMSPVVVARGDAHRARASTRMATSRAAPRAVVVTAPVAGRRARDAARCASARDAARRERRRRRRRVDVGAPARVRARAGDARG